MLKSIVRTYFTQLQWGKSHRDRQKYALNICCFWKAEYKQISKPNIRWNSPIKSWTTPPQQTKRQVDERMWATRKERRRYGRGVMLQCNSCSASHLLQVESSANRQTGTDPLRQAPGRVRDGQRESGTHGGGGTAWQEECTRKIH